MPRIPPLTERALTYAWNQLLVRAGAPDVQRGPPFSCGRVELLYQNPDDIGDREDCVVVAPCEDAAWRDLLNGRRTILQKYQSEIRLLKEFVCHSRIRFPFYSGAPIEER